jgi:hypothetical protein
VWDIYGSGGTFMVGVIGTNMVQFKDIYGSKTTILGGIRDIYGTAFFHRNPQEIAYREQYFTAA